MTSPKSTACKQIHIVYVVLKFPVSGTISKMFLKRLLEEVGMKGRTLNLATKLVLADHVVMRFQFLSVFPSVSGWSKGLVMLGGSQVWCLHKTKWLCIVLLTECKACLLLSLWFFFSTTGYWVRASQSRKALYQDQHPKLIFEIHISSLIEAAKWIILFFSFVILITL